MRASWLRRVVFPWSAVLAAIAAGVSLPAQQPTATATATGESPPDPGFVIRTETRLVLIPFHAVRKNQFVSGLRKDDIQILEDGKPQRIAVFEAPAGAGNARRSIPVQIILLLDVSLSVMNNDLLDPLLIKETFFDELGGNVTVSVYGFARKLIRFCRPTNAPARLDRALTAAYGSEGLGTKLYESIAAAGRDAARTGGNATRLMVIFSDGFSTTKALPKTAVEAARIYGITLYPVILGHERLSRRAVGRGGGGMGGGRARKVWGGLKLPGIGDPASGGNRRPQVHAQESRMAEFAAIGKQTGGRSFDPSMVNSLMMRAILNAVVAQVRSQYVAGYYPSGDSGGPGGKPRIVQVKLARNAKVKAKIRGGRRLVGGATHASGGRR